MPDLGFEKIHLADAHIVHGLEFPVAYKLVGEGSTRDIVEFLTKKGETGWFNDQVKLHGAIVLRDLGSTDPGTISEFIEAIGYSSGDKPFRQAGTTAKRTKLTDVITTANEGSPALYIDQHNEFSRFVQYPTKLFFACEKSTAEDGRTPITHGGEYFDNLYREHRREVEGLGRRGLFMRQTWPYETPNKTSWSDFFCFGRYIDKEKDDLDTKKQKAEVLIKSYVSKSFFWDPHNNLVVDQHTDPIRVYKRPDGVEFPAFFNSIATYYSDYKETYHDVYRKTSFLKYNDGEQIPDEFLDEILKASRDLAYPHTWKEGDIAIVDNYQVSHGRYPWKNGERTILVSMWDTPDKPEYPVWNGTTETK
ncbi:DEKNAAC103961 [Brettanomyces naardenensis]|uniref:DEKNAAC103961 n=1 Tax=Brettanomyces naardenensis TaxID=13370 RepID=A0A448YPQ2_BRENA|nr:DEKNAAC103961 [Brettanomyces naardenensis]